MPSRLADVLQGTLSMLILKSLAGESRDGYDVVRWIAGATRGTLAIEEGSLYPVLRRLEDRQFVTSEWRRSDTGRRVRMYTLTKSGRAHLEKEVGAWVALNKAITLVIRMEPALG